MVRTTGTDLRIRVSDGVTDYEGVVDDNGRYVISGLPLERPALAARRHHPTLHAGHRPGHDGTAGGVPAPAPPAVTLTLATDAPAVAAYWSAGQTVTGTLTLTSTASASQSLTLDWATSDPDWSLELAQDQVDLAAGATVQVPVTVKVLSDAAVDDAVRLTVRARDAAGGETTGAASVASDPDAAPIGTYQAWSVPDALLGGLNVASAALGGAPVVSIDPDAEAQLYDGVTPADSGFQTTMTGTPLALTVDLAGDAPVPVAGMSLDPLGGRLSILPGPKAIALLLSDDGSTWQEVMHARAVAADHRPVLRAPGTGPGSLRAAAHRLHVGRHERTGGPGRVEGHRHTRCDPRHDARQHRRPGARRTRGVDGSACLGTGRGAAGAER